MKTSECYQVYQDNQAIVKEKLRAIGRLIADHKKTFNGENWGFVGDLDSCISKLDDIIEQLKKD